MATATLLAFGDPPAEEETQSKSLDTSKESKKTDTTADE